MRIAVCGISNLGKIKFINNFLTTWPMYKKVEGKHKKLLLNQKPTNNVNEQFGSQKFQELILNTMVDETMEFKKTDNIIHDYSILDNLCYTMWLASHNLGNIDDGFVNLSMALTKQALHFYDIIFYLPKLEKYNIDEEVDAFNESDQVFFEEYDNLLKAIQDSYTRGQELLFEFSSVDGAPAMLEIYGTAEERIQMVKLYLDEKGQPLGGKSEDSLLQIPNLGLEEFKDVDTLIKQVEK